MEGLSHTPVSLKHPVRQPTPKDIIKGCALWLLAWMTIGCSVRGPQESVTAATSGTDARIPTPAPLQMDAPIPPPTSVTWAPEPTPIPPQPEEPRWFFPDASSIQSFVSSSPVVTLQRDVNEYQNFTHPDIQNVMNNACGPAVIASVLRLFSYARDGTVPSVHVGDIISQLSATQVDWEGGAYPYFLPNHEMDAYSFRQALRVYSDDLYQVVDITSVGSPGAGGMVESPILDQAFIEGLQQNVFSQGGVVTFLGLKPYRADGGPTGHIVYATSMSWDAQFGPMVTYVDSWTGSVHTGQFNQEFLPNTAGQPGVAAFTGLVPNLGK